MRGATSDVGFIRPIPLQTSWKRVLTRFEQIQRKDISLTL